MITKFQQIKFSKIYTLGLNPDFLLSCQPLLTFTQKCLLCLCEIPMDPHSSMVDFVQFV